MKSGFYIHFTSLRENVSNWLVSRIRISFFPQLPTMKKIYLLLVFAMVLACSRQGKDELILTNSADNDRPDAGLAIPKTYFESFQKEDGNTIPVVKTPDGKLVPTQLDDTDGDGTWDEMFLVTDFKAGETKHLKVEFIPSTEKYPTFNVRTNIRFASKKDGYKEVKSGTREKHAINTLTAEDWQLEGIGFENDHVGFRNYFDRRNGIDIFGKVIHTMILDSVGYKDFPDYHVFNPDWGMDVLKVAESLGAGSIAYEYQDSLYRVGDNGTGTINILDEGPLRSMFSREFPDWKMKQTQLSVKHIISIEAGTYYYESQVSYEGLDEDLELVTGLVNRKCDSLYHVTLNNEYEAFYTHDIQAEDTTMLTLALLVKSGDLIGTSVTPDTGGGITETYCIHLRARPGEKVFYRFYSFWETENHAWADRKNIEKFLVQEGDYLTHPVVIR